MGTRLNTAKSIFISTIAANIKERAGILLTAGTNLRTKPKTNAIDKLDKGPAKATFKEPYF